MQRQQNKEEKHYLSLKNESYFTQVQLEAQIIAILS